MLLRGMGGLALLWATAVLLGGFVSSLHKRDFWYITIITVVQAAGLFNVVSDSQWLHLRRRIRLLHPRVKHDQPHRASPLMASIRSMISKAIASIAFITVLFLERSFRLHPQSLCAGMAGGRLMDTKYVSAYKDNLKHGLDLFYFLCVAQEMPEDNVSGARLLTTLIDKGVPVRPLLLRSPRHRIQNLIGTLAWRSPAEQEMRFLAARIVAHVAPDLSLAQFPGALECISSLLGTSAYKDSDREGTYFAAQLSTNSYMIFEGLKILENLALDEHNCKLICSTEALLSKIVAPVTSQNLVENTNKNTSWAKVTNGSLKLLSRLMRSPGDTGKEMRRRVADCSSAVKNLEDFLAQEPNSNNIMVLQIRAIEILEHLCSGESTTSIQWTGERRENLIVKVLHIFFTDKWMEDYLSNTRSKLEDETASKLDKGKKSKKSQQQFRQLVENKMKAAQETVNLLKEKAGEALATLCRGNQITSDYIMSFTGASHDVVHHLTGMLDSEESTIRCRICAPMILKHMCTHSTLDFDGRYLKETTLNKVLKELLHIKTEGQATSIETRISQGGNDIEYQGGGGHGERPPVSVLSEKHEERRLQIALLSLCAVIRGRWINAPDFAGVVAQLTSPEDLAEKLKKLVEENSYGTPACWAALKLTFEIVIALIPHDNLAGGVKMKEDIVDSLSQVSKTMAGLECCMLFAGTDRDCYGLPVKPFFSDLVEKAREDLKKKKQELGLNAV